MQFIKIKKMLSMKLNFGNVWFQLCQKKTHQKRKVITPVLTTRKMLDKLKINDFSWNHQRQKL